MSTIYLEGLGAGRKTGALPEQPVMGRLSKAEISRLRPLLGPPSSVKSQVTRPIHPDLILLVFSGVLPIFLAGILSSQRALLLPVILVLVVFYLLYFWQRKRLIDRFTQQYQSVQNEKRQVERAIGRWMKTYYCAQDDIVFEAGLNKWAPVEQAERLMREGWQEVG